MTGRDLIIYILENDLENEDLFKDGKLISFMTISEAALAFNVGTETIKAWYELGLIYKGIKIGEEIFIPKTIL